jgi:DNA-binding winged helix-turn-helix (wHTH) protein
MGRRNGFTISSKLDRYIANIREYLNKDPTLEILNIPNQGIKLVTKSQ